MREDLNKVLCESPRVGGLDFHWYRKQKEELDSVYEDYDDDIPHSGDSSRGRVGMRSSKLYWNGRRHFNEHLSPLRGIIRKNVGRPWDKVYGELCQVFDRRSVINQHILLHLDQYVETKHIVVNPDGRLYYQTHSRWSNVYVDGLVPLKESSINWYVDPRDGILKDNKGNNKTRQRINQRKKEREQEQLDQKRVYTNGVEIERYNGQWFIYRYEVFKQVQELVSERYLDKETNLFKKRDILKWVYPETRDYRGCSVRQARVCVFTKQMNKQELKQYGVQNRPVESEQNNAKLKRLEH